MDIRKVKKLIELLEESGHRRARDLRGRGVGAHQPRLPRQRRCTPGSRDLAAAAPGTRPPRVHGGRAGGAGGARSRRRTGRGTWPCARRWSAPSIARPRTGRQCLRRGRPAREGRRGDLHRRGDEDDEPHRADKAGKIEAILVEDGQPVEFDQPLFTSSDHRPTASAPESPSMLDKVVIANRGEIALRILRACKELGIKTVAVHSKADRDLMHVRLADEAVCIGPSRRRESYLNAPAIISAAEITDAEAIHPGYGFPRENADFAEQVEKSGFVFIGPTAERDPPDGRQGERP
jgi:hypothetical protein